MTTDEAVGIAKQITTGVQGGAGYWGRLWDAVAGALLAVENHTAKRCAEIADNYVDDDAGGIIRGEFGIEDRQ